MYAASRAEEMAQLTDWSEQQRDEFLRFQFRAQDHHYREHYPDARIDVVLYRGTPIGRLYLDWQEAELRVMDIALLPEWRRRGIGRSLLEDVMREAAAQGLLVSLHVEQENPAMGLYRELGFEVVGNVSFYKLMHWQPGAADVS